MYAPVAVVDPVAVEQPVLPRVDSAVFEGANYERKASVKDMEQGEKDGGEQRRRRRVTVAKRAAVVLVAAALVVALGLAAVHFVHTDAFDDFVHWLQVLFCSHCVMVSRVKRWCSS